MYLFLLACHAPNTPEVIDMASAIWGSRTMLSSLDEQFLYTLHSDEEQISWYNRTTGDIGHREVLGHPSRLARLGDQIVVSLRGDASLAVLETQNGTLVETTRVAVGTEPLGLVARPDGSRLYVALWSENVVLELDSKLSELRRFSVPGHPSWLALHPSGQTLFVGAAYEGGMFWLDLNAETPEVQAIDMPVISGSSNQILARRITGDPDISADGTRLAVPSFWVDLSSSETPPADARFDASLNLSNPGITMVALDTSGHPTDTQVLYATGLADLESMENPEVVRSYLSSVQFSPDGSAVAASMECAQGVIVFGTQPERWESDDGGFVVAPSVFLATGAGPRGLDFVADALWIHNFLDVGIAKIDESVFQAALQTDSTDPASRETLQTDPTIPLIEQTLDADLLEGRAHYYSVVMPEVSYPLAGASCSTCHFEGRNDGLTWPIRGSGYRQTPSLSGHIASTAPFTWTNAMPTVASQIHLSGPGINDVILGHIADFVETFEAPEGGAYDTEAAARGQVLFERQDVGCAGCHYGAQYTDNNLHELYGLASVNTPTLLGIATTAPYLHDGSVPSLRAVLETARQREMGDTSMLSEAEMLDLEEYLKSL